MKFFKKAVLIGLLSVLGLGAEAFADNDFEFHGYARSGVMYNAGLKEVGSFELNRVGRLGNEDSSPYMEAELVKNIKSGKAWSKYHVMFALGSSSESTWDGENPVVRQAYVEMGGLSFSPTSTIWAGKRFYGRDDIHITDLYWRNFSGTGAGIQGLAGGNLDLAIINGNNPGTVDEDGQKVTNLTLDARYRIGSLELQGAFSTLAGNSDKHDENLEKDKDGKPIAGKYVNKDNAENGIQVAAVYGMSNFFGIASGFSKVALQYGMNASAGNVGDIEWGNNGKDGDAMMRAVAFGMGEFGNWQIMPQLAFQMTTPDEGEDKMHISAVIRPELTLNENFVLGFEAGIAQIDNGKNADGKDISGMAYKATVAPIIKLDSTGFWNRPELRFFVSYVGQDKDLGKVSADGKDESEIRIGTQAEVWF